MCARLSLEPNLSSQLGLSLELFQKGFGRDLADLFVEGGGRLGRTQNLLGAGSAVADSRGGIVVLGGRALALDVQFRQGPLEGGLPGDGGGRSWGRHWIVLVLG